MGQRKHDAGKPLHSTGLFMCKVAGRMIAPLDILLQTKAHMQRLKNLAWPAHPHQLALSREIPSFYAFESDCTDSNRQLVHHCSRPRGGPGRRITGFSALKTYAIDHHNGWMDGDECGGVDRRSEIGPRVASASRDETMTGLADPMKEWGSKETSIPGFKGQPLYAKPQQTLSDYMGLLQSLRNQKHQHDQIPLRTSVHESSNGSCTLNGPLSSGQNAQMHRR